MTGLHEFPILQRQKLAPDKPRHARPRYHGNGDDDADDRRLHDGHQQDRKNEGGDCLKNLGNTHQKIIKTTTIISRKGTKNDADENRNKCCNQANQQTRLGTMHYAGGHIPAKRVAAKQKSIHSRSRQGLSGQSEGVKRVQEVRCRRHDDDKKNDTETENGGFVAPVALPECRHVRKPRSVGRGNSR